MHILNSIENLKKEFDSIWEHCDLCKNTKTPGKYGDNVCQCVLERNRIIRKINSGLPRDLLLLEDKDIQKMSIFKKLEGLLKNPSSFVDMGLGIFLYGDTNIGKTKVLAHFFSNCICSDQKKTGLFINFSELVELIRRRRMDNKLASEIDRLLNRKIIFIDNLYDEMEERLFPDTFQILEQIFLRQNSAILLTADNVYESSHFRFPNNLKEFLFNSKKIRPISIRTSKSKTSTWDGRIFRGEKRGRI